MNNFNNIEVYTGLSWAQAIEGAQLLGTDLTYDYDHGEGIEPSGGFPGTTLGLDNCAEPTNDDTYVTYAYKSVILDPNFEIYVSHNITVYDENGNTHLLEPGTGEIYHCKYALFCIDSSGGKVLVKLVKGTDFIDTAYDYIWLPVLIDIEWQK